MIRIVIFGVLAFVLGLGGTTGALVLTTPVHPAGADSTHVAKGDSAAAVPHPGVAHPAPVHLPALPEATRSESTAAVPAHPVPAGIATSTSVAAAGGGAAPVVTSVTPLPGVHEGPSTFPPDAESYKQVGTILLNMKPAEAAKILGYLNDEQVEGLLRSMSPRNAAGLMGQLPPERGAALSRRLLHPLKEDRP